MDSYWDLVSVSPPSKPSPCAPSNPLDLKLNSLSTLTPAAKRARNVPTGAGHVAARCLVQCCEADLGKCREYHRRHKVCEVHSKSRVVTVSGREQRFCQQCSRFHLLVEFDDAKRSCRKRLEGHNRRRRKPPTVNNLNPKGFCANYQGLLFGSYPLNTIKSEPISFNPPSLFPKFKPQIKFPFLHDEFETQIHPNRTIFTSTLSSDCALSLLSSPPLISTCTVPDNNLVPGFQYGASYNREFTSVSSFGANSELNRGMSNFQGLSQQMPFPNWH